ncbi:hypothetical protein [Parendozoicomonas sp. Alg238-R29]|uniref:hypothetical protein n=1 Tax=Parendozoicomonas sp. Alg238-R29 TaxID=2993446 RepID=UPI00248E6513|nr:hypothetical protein [Parendozoicomonas sp. Alg238-R29]
MTKYYGYFFKVLSLASKFLFLILIVPQLSDGVFSEYYLVLTYILIFSRLLSFGASENIAIKISGEICKVHDFFCLYVVFISFSVLMFLLSNFFGGYYIAMALVACFCASNVFSGLFRGFAPETYELNINLPWILFFIGALLFDASTHVSLLNILFCSYILTQVLVFLYVKSQLRIVFHIRAISQVGRIYFEMIPSGSIRQFSIINQIIFIRLPFVLPDTLSLLKLNDSVALGLSIVEGVWQLFMVPVNRRFSKYCNNKVLFYECYKSIISTFVMFLSILPLFYLLTMVDFFEGYVQIPAFEELYIPVFILSSVLLLADIRYWLWSHDRWSSVICFEVAVIVPYALISYFTALYDFKSYMCSSIFLFSCSLVLLMYMTLRERVMNRSPII